MNWHFLFCLSSNFKTPCYLIAISVIKSINIEYIRNWQQNRRRQQITFGDTYVYIVQYCLVCWFHEHKKHRYDPYIAVTVNKIMLATMYVHGIIRYDIISSNSIITCPHLFIYPDVHMLLLHIVCCQYFSTFAVICWAI